MTTQLPTSLLWFFWFFVKKQPIAFLVFFIAPMAMVFEANVIPYALKMIVDVITEFQGDRQEIVAQLAPALWLGGSAWIALMVITRLQNWWQCTVLPRFQAQVRMSLLDYVTSHSYTYFANHFAGNIAAKISDMPRALDAVRMIICWKCITAAAVIVVALIIMATINPIFSTILGGWIALQLPVLLFFSRRVNRAAAKNAEDKSRLAGQIVDSLTNITNVKLFARSAYEQEYIGQAQVKEQQSNYHQLFQMNFVKLMMDIPGSFLLGLMVFTLIKGWQAGWVSTGDFVFVIFATVNLLFNMWFLAMELPNLFREIGVANQALTLVQKPHGIVDRTQQKLKVSQGVIEFHNVSFGYHAKAQVFKSKSVRIESGQKIGLVGFSGSGKSTFVNLILRFFEVDSGKITIDGQDIAIVRQDSLRSQIAMIPQDTTLFHRSLMENIRYGRLEATDAEVIEAAKRAHAHEFILELPDQYDALVGERGIKLSGGQRQRIAVARAILKDAPILLLDEATSALDSVTEKYIQQSLHKLMQGRTTVVIAHRLSTLSEMDRILVFDQGRIIEDGTHDQLLKAKGHYAKMWQMQALGFLPDEEKPAV